MNVSEFIEVELDLATKREISPHDFFYKCTNLNNLLGSQSIYFKGPNRDIQFSSQTTKFSFSLCLMISNFVNSISSSILRNGVFN
jgi:hypothetical protein